MASESDQSSNDDIEYDYLSFKEFIESKLSEGISRSIPVEDDESLGKSLDKIAKSRFNRRVTRSVDLWIESQSRRRRRLLVSQIQDVLGRVAEDWLMTSASILGPDSENVFLTGKSTYRGKKWELSVADRASHPFVKASISGTSVTLKNILPEQGLRWETEQTRAMHIEPLTCRSSTSEKSMSWILVLESKMPGALDRVGQFSQQLRKDVGELSFLVTCLLELKSGSNQPRAWTPTVDGWNATGVLTDFCKKASHVFSKGQQFWAISVLHADRPKEVMFALGTAGFDYALVAPNRAHMLKSSSYSWKKVFAAAARRVHSCDPVKEPLFENAAKAKNMGVMECISTVIPSAENSGRLRKCGVLHLFRFADVLDVESPQKKTVRLISGRSGMLWDGYINSRKRIACKFLSWRMLASEAGLASTFDERSRDKRTVLIAKHFSFMCVLEEVLAVDAVTILRQESEADVPARLCSTNRDDSVSSTGLPDSPNQAVLPEENSRNRVNAWLTKYTDAPVRLNSILGAEGDIDMASLPEFPANDFQHETMEVLPTATEDRRLLGIGVVAQNGVSRFIVKLIRSSNRIPFTREDANLLKLLIKRARTHQCFSD